MVHLPFFVWKLPCSICRCIIHDIGRDELGISCGNVIIQKILNHRPLKLGTLAFVECKPTASNLDTCLKVYQVIFCDQVPVRNSATMKDRNFSLLTNHRIVFCSFSSRNCVAGQIGNPQQHAFNDCFYFCQLSSIIVNCLFDGSHLGFLGLSVFFLALCNQHANGFGGYIAFSKQFIRLKLKRLSQVV